MNVTPIKTHKITTDDTDILKVLDQYLPPLKEKTIIAITSKIVAICEGRVVQIEDGVDKDEIIMREAELYLERTSNRHGFFVTVKNNMMIMSSGIDESNGNGDYILWPENPQKSANLIRAHIAKSKGLNDVGVVITDSKTTPLRWGVTGVAVAHSGFAALNSYIDQPDIFGKHLRFSKANIADGIAASSVMLMGEGNEQTPICIVEDLPFVTFQRRNPTDEELAGLHIPLEDDIYSGLLMNVPWKKGKKNHE